MFMIESLIIEIAEILTGAVSSSLKVSESKDMSVIDSEAQKQALELQMAHAQAKVAQELAIAQRIENADEVVIEEYYAGEAKGNVGATGDEKGITVGASAEGRKVTKRVYRFIGRKQKDNTAEIIEQDSS
jgi:hypothetical protein